ncbi:MAG: transporter [Fibrobacter sp.]|nr:transporter [Fibrobacter sp.]
MLKKLAFIATVTTTMSFAAWDLYPVLDEHKGETEVGAGFVKFGETYSMTFYGASRYTILPSFELGAAIPYYMALSESHVNGLMSPIFMARYQFLPFMNTFLDVTIPTYDESSTRSAWSFLFGVQYSQKFGVVNFGSELGLQMETGGEYEITPPWVLNASLRAELDFGILVVPFVGVKGEMAIGAYTTKDGDESDSYTGDFVVFPEIGARIAINSKFGIEASVSTGFGDEIFIADETPLVADLHFNYKF